MKFFLIRLAWQEWYHKVSDFILFLIRKSKWHSANKIIAPYVRSALLIHEMLAEQKTRFAKDYAREIGSLNIFK